MTLSLSLTRPYTVILILACKPSSTEACSVLNCLMTRLQGESKRAYRRKSIPGDSQHLGPHEVIMDPRRTVTPNVWRRDKSNALRQLKFLTYRTLGNKMAIS